MTLEQLGSLGEFIAAVGIIFSLVFVGWELQKTRRQSNVDGPEELMNSSQQR